MAEKANIYIDRGADFSAQFFLYNEDETPDNNEYSIQAQIRKHALSNSGVNFSASQSNNTITISLTSSQTTDLEMGHYIYDIKIQDEDDKIRTAFSGMAIVNPAATLWD